MRLRGMPVFFDSASNVFFSEAGSVRQTCGYLRRLGARARVVVVASICASFFSAQRLCQYTSVYG